MPAGVPECGEPCSRDVDPNDVTSGGRAGVIFLPKGEATGGRLGRVNGAARVGLYVASVPFEEVLLVESCL